MKKLLILFAFMAVVFIEAKVCTSSCYYSAGGYGIGMGWNIPRGSSCTGHPPIGATVYYAYALGDYVFDTGVVDGWDVTTTVGC